MHVRTILIDRYCFETHLAIWYNRHSYPRLYHQDGKNTIVLLPHIVQEWESYQFGRRYDDTEGNY